MSTGRLTIFSLNAGKVYAKGVAGCLDLELAAHEERDFEDGEHKSRPLVNVCDHDVFVVQSLSHDERHSVNDHLCRLLFFLGAIKDASAARVTAVVPYLCYARKDQRSKPRDPVTTRYVAAMFEAVGVDRVVTMDVHNLAAFQNALRCQTEHLEARPLLVRHFVSLLQHKEAVVVSPDVGGIKRAERFRQSLAKAIGRPVSMGFMEKQRSEGLVSGEAFIGQVEGKVAIIVDDLISTGTTLVRAATACRERGATGVYAAATHGVLVGDARKTLADAPFDHVVVTDTITSDRISRFESDKLVVLKTAPYVAEAIRRMHEGESLVEMMQD